MPLPTQSRKVNVERAERPSIGTAWDTILATSLTHLTRHDHTPMGTDQGSCHCGAIRFEIDTDFPELTMCDCSICRRKNALMVKVHERQFRLLVGADSLTEYRFHTHTARHFFCKVCGIYPFHLARTRLTVMTGPDTPR